MERMCTFSSPGIFSGPNTDINSSDSPRKINQIITPYGFEFKGGKVVKIGEDGAPAATATPAADDTIAQATPATPATRKKMSKKATPAVKKRKIDETSSEEVNTEEVEAKGDDVDDEDGGN